LVPVVIGGTVGHLLSHLRVRKVNKDSKGTYLDGMKCKNNEVNE